MKPLLVLIGFQHDTLCRPGMEPAPGAVAERGARLLEIGRALGLPVVHVRTAVSRPSDDRPPRGMVEEGPGEPVIYQAGPGAPAAPGLNGLLRQQGADTLIVAGVPLHDAVRHTAVDAARSGWNVWIADDAVASDDPLDAAITRRYLEELTVCFPTVEQVDQWLRVGKPAAQPRPAEMVRAAVDRAADHAAAWRVTGMDHRAERVHGLMARLAEDAHSLASLMADELGKPVRFCRVEVERTGEMLAAILARVPPPDAGSTGRVVTVRRRPHGTVAIITPFNNPVYLPLGKIVPPIVYGNTVVWKPAPEAAQVSLRIMALLRAAGWPEGLVGAVPGDRRVGQALVNDPRIDAVSITGSSAAGFSAQEACARRRIPLQAELGGNNAAIVWDDADLADAARQVAAGAFDMAGQRCTANRRVIVHPAIRDRFLALLLAESRDLPWGDPRDERTRIGPLVSSARRDFVAGMVDRALRSGAAPLWPQGRDLPVNGRSAAAWYPPVILGCDDPESEIVQEETFGPVLVVQKAGNWQEAIDRCNGVRQGLAAAIFTRSVAVAERFLEEAQAGILKLNRSTADAAVDAPFGGWKASGLGPPEHGEFDLDAFTRPQTVYGNPLDTAHS